MAEQYNEYGLKERIVKKAWEDEEFKAELLQNPKAAIEKELEVTIPEDIEIKVVEETANTIYLVLPACPTEAEEEAAAGAIDLESRAMTYIP